MSREPSAHSMTIDHVDLGEGAREHLAVRLREAESRARRAEMELENTRDSLTLARKEIVRLGVHIGELIAERDGLLRKGFESPELVKACDDYRQRFEQIRDMFRGAIDAL